MFLLDRFFDGTFFTYGIEVMSFADRDQEDRIDPMIYVFPRYWESHINLIQAVLFIMYMYPVTEIGTPYKLMTDDPKKHLN